MIELGIYQHYKGDYYDVLGTALDRETSTEYVIYRNAYGELQIGSVTEFTEMVTVPSHNLTGPRFRKVESLSHPRGTYG